MLCANVFIITFFSFLISVLLNAISDRGLQRILKQNINYNNRARRSRSNKTTLPPFSPNKRFLNNRWRRFFSKRCFKQKIIQAGKETRRRIINHPLEESTYFSSIPPFPYFPASPTTFAIRGQPHYRLQSDPLT